MYSQPEALRMGHSAEEYDFLAGTKPFHEETPRTFADVVREAFLFEHHCAKDQDIARVLDLTPGRISQTLKHPRVLKAESVHHLVSALSSKANRRAIIKAWQQACFGDVLDAEGSDSLVGTTVNLSITKRIDRLIAQYRPDRALLIARNALEKAEHPELRIKLYWRCFYLASRLDELGLAMQTCNGLYTLGKQDNNLPAMACALMMRIQTLRRMGGTSLSRLEAERQQVYAILECIKAPREIANEITPTEQRMRNNRISIVLSHEEQYGRDESTLKSLLRDVRISVDPNESNNSISGRLLMESRIHVALGDFFKAEETLDAAFEKSDVSLAACSISGMAKARIIAARGLRDEAISYYEGLVDLCERERHVYLYGVAQRDLGRLRGEMFPPTHPV